MFIHGQASQGRYSIQFSPYAERDFRNAPPEIRARIRRRLEEIADVAGHLTSTIAGPASSALRLEIDGHLVSYVLSDAERLLVVTSVVSFAAQRSAANE